MHGHVRVGLCDHIIVPAIKDEANVNIGAETAGDLVRGARTTILMMNPNDPQVYRWGTLKRCLQFGFLVVWG